MEGRERQKQERTFTNTFLFRLLLPRATTLRRLFRKGWLRRQILVAEKGLAGRKDANGEIGVRKGRAGVEDVLGGHLAGRKGGLGLCAPALTSCSFGWGELGCQDGGREDWEEAVKVPRPLEASSVDVNGRHTLKTRTVSGRNCGLRLHLYRIRITKE